MRDDPPRPDRTLRARDPSGRVWRAAEGEAPTLSPLARQGAAATALRAGDPELERVRRLLADLRPDCANPWEPPVRTDLVEAIPVGAMPRDSSVDWGGIPRGLFDGAEEAAAMETSRRCVAEVRGELEALPPDARAVLVWCREHATLGAAGLRGLYADAGMAFASEAQSVAWEDLGARREGAPTHGRHLVLHAAGAWGR